MNDIKYRVRESSHGVGFIDYTSLDDVPQHLHVKIALLDAASVDGLATIYGVGVKSPSMTYVGAYTYTITTGEP